MAAGSSLERTSEALADGRRDSEWILRRAREHGERIEADARTAVARLYRLRAGQLSELRDSLRESSREIEQGYALLAESLAVLSASLLAQAAGADYSAPPGRGEIDRTIELRLGQTDELRRQARAGVRR